VADEAKKESAGKKDEPLGVLGWLVVILLAPVVIGAVLAWHFGLLVVLAFPDWLDKVRAEHPVLSGVVTGVVLLVGVLTALARLSGPAKEK
jgi:hypothetical protein